MGLQSKCTPTLPAGLFVQPACYLDAGARWWRWCEFSLFFWVRLTRWCIVSLTENDSPRNAFSPLFITVVLSSITHEWSVCVWMSGQLGWVSGCLVHACMYLASVFAYVREQPHSDMDVNLMCIISLTDISNSLFSIGKMLWRRGSTPHWLSDIRTVPITNTNRNTLSRQECNISTHQSSVRRCQQFAYWAYHWGMACRTLFERKHTNPILQTLEEEKGLGEHER